MVALKPGAIERFVAAAGEGNIDAVLVYGPDRGLVAERAKALLGRFTDDPHDPFAVSYLDDSELSRAPERLAEELGAMAFGGGRRTVFVRAGTATPSDALAAALAEPRAAALIIEAGDLRPTSALRKAFEAAPDGAAVPCYSDSGDGIDRLIDQVLGELGQTIGEEARAELTARLGADRLASRGEIEKLALYAGPGVQITAGDVAAISSDVAQTSLDGVVDAMGEGETARLEVMFARALGAGSGAGQIASAALRHLQRLHRLASSGRKVDKSVLGRERPPVFWARQDSFLRQLRRWREPQLRRALDVLGEAERASRLDPVLAESAVARALLQVALLPR